MPGKRRAQSSEENWKQREITHLRDCGAHAGASAPSVLDLEPDPQFTWLIPPRTRLQQSLFFATRIRARQVDQAARPIQLEWCVNPVPITIPERAHIDWVTHVRMGLWRLDVVRLNFAARFQNLEAPAPRPT